MELPAGDWFAILFLVLAMGARHGLDPDHLATIDGLTRYNAVLRPRLARFCGTLFSLGHGAVVVLIALAVNALSSHWHEDMLPPWLDRFGAWTSLSVLCLLGVLNLLAVWRAQPHEIVQPLGFKGRLLGRLAHTAHPLLIALVGALFALSFDTVSQAALFALTAHQLGDLQPSWLAALALGLTFMLGMLATDGLNGLWIARLIRRADATARLASRLMSLLIGGLSLTIAALGGLRLASRDIAAWSDGKELYFGVLLLLVSGAGYLGARLLARQTRAS